MENQLSRAFHLSRIIKVSEHLKKTFYQQFWEAPNFCADKNNFYGKRIQTTRHLNAFCTADFASPSIQNVQNPLTLDCSVNPPDLEKSRK